jgi:hypothetical protein
MLLRQAEIPRLAADVVGEMLSTFRAMDSCNHGYVSTERARSVLTLVTGSALSCDELNLLLQKYRVPLPRYVSVRCPADGVEEETVSQRSRCAHDSQRGQRLTSRLPACQR